MTQTVNRQPLTAMTFIRPVTGSVRLTFVPLTSVALAREEFGPTLADAQAFVEGTCCTECGVSAEETRVDGHECRSCGIQGCACQVVQDPHDADVYWCNGCRPVCGGYCCND